jgi:hypothetical protein
MTAQDSPWKQIDDPSPMLLPSLSIYRPGKTVQLWIRYDQPPPEGSPVEFVERWSVVLRNWYNQDDPYYQEEYYYRYSTDGGLLFGEGDQGRIYHSREDAFTRNDGMPLVVALGSILRALVWPDEWEAICERRPPVVPITNRPQ